MCDETARIMAIVRTVKYIEKVLKRELSYTDLQVIVKASNSNGLFALDHKKQTRVITERY